MDNQQSDPLINEENSATMEVQHEKEYGGIRRLRFFLCGVLHAALLRLEAKFFEDDFAIGCSIFILAYVILVVATYYRMKNIGHNPWFSLLAFIPIVHVVVSAWSQILPEGYWDTKKLDTVAIVLLVLHILFFLLAIIALIVFIAFMGVAFSNM